MVSQINHLIWRFALGPFLVCGGGMVFILAKSTSRTKIGTLRTFDRLGYAIFGCKTCLFLISCLVVSPRNACIDVARRDDEDRSGGCEMLQMRSDLTSIEPVSRTGRRVKPAMNFGDLYRKSISVIPHARRRAST
jgi:hypothetical protein